jgi:hypothetical protein
MAKLPTADTMRFNQRFPSTPQLPQPEGGRLCVAEPFCHFQKRRKSLPLPLSSKNVAGAPNPGKEMF